jgi:hypothetical protein
MVQLSPLLTDKTARYHQAANLSPVPDRIFCRRYFSRTGEIASNKIGMWRRVLNGQGHERMTNLRLSYAQTVKIVVDFSQEKDIYLTFTPLPFCSVMLPQLQTNEK